MYNSDIASNMGDMLPIFKSSIAFVVDNEIPKCRFIKHEYNCIKAFLLMGCSVQHICNILNENGIEITYKTLKTELFRIRKKLGEKSIRAQIDDYFYYSRVNGMEMGDKKIVDVFNTPVKFD